VLDLKFEKPYPLTGRVVDSTVSRISRAKVTISCDYLDEKEMKRTDTSDYRALYEGARILPDDFVTISDAEGRFAFTSVPPERSCGLSVEHPDYTGGLARIATSEHPPERERSFPLSPLPLTMTLRWRHKIPIRAMGRHRPAGRGSISDRVPEQQERWADSGTVFPTKRGT